MQLVDQKTELFTNVGGRGSLGPNYAVIDGEQIRRELPKLHELWEQRVRPAAEEAAGARLQLLGSPRRSIRVQRYTGQQQGFRWHFDGHEFAALVTLENTNRGETQFISPGLSRALRWLVYPLYPLPGLFTLVPHRRIDAEPGDLLLMRGGDMLHRGVTLVGEGERVLVIYAYDRLGKQPNPLRDRIATWLNY